jgi:hypothetical protein
LGCWYERDSNQTPLEFTEPLHIRHRRPTVLAVSLEQGDFADGEHGGGRGDRTRALGRLERDERLSMALKPPPEAYRESRRAGYLSQATAAC